MSQISVQVSADHSEIKLVMSGMISEETEFPNLDNYPAKKLIFDLQELTYINSLGIRDWVEWIEPLSAKFKIFMINCPKRLIHQFNAVSGFLPEGARILSFYAPYFCEKCGFLQDFLFEVGKDVIVKNNIVSVAADIQKFKDCKVENCQLELDSNPTKFFKFLRKSPN